MSDLSPSPHKVLIVGAGLAGLLLAILLERANIPYKIFERASTLKPLGAVMCLNANILPVFEQLSLLDELMALSLPSYSLNLLQGDLSLIAEIKMKNVKELVGYDYIVFPRPDLYNLLLSKIPKEKVHLGKKVLSIQQNEHGVMIRVADNTTYHGDILVGADGAYSGVRQSLYKELEKHGKLPAEDAKQMYINYSTIVGTTNSLDASFHDDLKDPFTHNSFMIGIDSPYTWSTFTMPGNRICWSVNIQLDARESEDESFRNSEWSSDTNQGLIKEIYEFKTPYGKLGKLIDATENDRISKVYLEDKLFKTWHHGRTVLIGDAAHKLLPSAGQGAVNAMQDAVILANCLYDLSSVTLEGISDALKDYRDQRYSHVLAQYEASKRNAKIMYGQTWWERLARNIVFKYLPESARTKNLVHELSYRPQATFIPQVPNRGTSEVIPQKQSKKYEDVQKQATASDP
ncbi:hypothetical protein BGX28_002768 [Mortierella sp. GBA30]|nr:hypothetical protein BGX28_002768 [Mortierella sp. GBA30]